MIRSSKVGCPSRRYPSKPTMLKFASKRSSKAITSTERITRPPLPMCPRQQRRNPALEWWRKTLKFWSRKCWHRVILRRELRLWATMGSTSLRALWTCWWRSCRMMRIVLCCGRLRAANKLSARRLRMIVRATCKCVCSKERLLIRWSSTLRDSGTKFRR